MTQSRQHHDIALADANRRNPSSGRLTDEEQRAWRALAGVIITLPSVLDSDLLARSGISHFDYLVMSRLAETPGRQLRMSELAAMTDSSLSRLSHVVSKLEKRGWIIRAANPDDGRYTNAQLTDSGHQKVMASAPGHLDTVRTVLIDALTSQQLAQLTDIAGAMLEQIRGLDRPVRPLSEAQVAANLARS